MMSKNNIEESDNYHNYMNRMRLSNNEEENENFLDIDDDSNNTVNDIDFNSDSEGDNLNISMFTNNRALVVIDNKELFDRKLEENKVTQNSELNLNGKFIDHLPEELKLYTWVTIMSIETTEIKSLTENLPPNLKKLIVRSNNIKLLDGSVLPDSLKSLIFQNNNACEIVGLKDGLLELDVSNNLLKELGCKFPTTLTKFAVSNNKMFQLNQLFPDSLKELVANDTNIKSIDDFNDNIEKISTCRCYIPIVKKFPANLKEWKNYVSNTHTIECKFPEGMTHLDMFNNSLSKCPIIPNTMIDVDLSNNDLEEVPEFFPTLQKIDLKQNKKLKAEDIQIIQKEMQGVNILYDSFKQNIYSSVDDDWESEYGNYNFNGGHYKPHYVHNNYANNYENNYGNNYGNSYTIRAQSSYWKPEFADSDPDVVPLNKTYVLS